MRYLTGREAHIHDAAFLCPCPAAYIYFDVTVVLRLSHQAVVQGSKTIRLKSCHAESNAISISAYIIRVRLSVYCKPFLIIIYYIKFLFFVEDSRDLVLYFYTVYTWLKSTVR